MSLPQQPTPAQHSNTGTLDAHVCHGCGVVVISALCLQLSEQLCKRQGRWRGQGAWHFLYLASYLYLYRSVHMASRGLTALRPGRLHLQVADMSVEQLGAWVGGLLNPGEMGLSLDAKMKAQVATVQAALRQHQIDGECMADLTVRSWTMTRAVQLDLN